jgi:hypothetical protein
MEGVSYLLLVGRELSFEYLSILIRVCVSEESNEERVPLSIILYWSRPIEVDSLDVHGLVF